MASTAGFPEDFAESCKVCVQPSSSNKVWLARTSIRCGVASARGLHPEFAPEID